MPFLISYICFLQYIYIITGEEITKLARDYIRYLFGGSQSVRLKNAMYQCGLIYNTLTAPKEEEDEDSEFWLEEAILNTPTWWHDPDDYREVLKNYLLSGSDEAMAMRDHLGLESDEHVRYYLESDYEDDEDDNDDDSNENEGDNEINFPWLQSIQCCSLSAIFPQV